MYFIKGYKSQKPWESHQSRLDDHSSGNNLQNKTQYFASTRVPPGTTPGLVLVIPDTGDHCWTLSACASERPDVTVWVICLHLAAKYEGQESKFLGSGTVRSGVIR